MSVRKSRRQWGVILGLLVPGLGKIYAGYLGWSLAYLLTLFVGFALVLLGGPAVVGVLLMGLSAFVWLMSPFSGGLAARKTDLRLKLELGLM